MKKFFLALLSFIFLLSFSAFSMKVYAQLDSSIASSSSKPDAAINYELPYPGLLPDNPLYFLRVIRDRAVSFLISDPLKKSEFDLLQADKRLNAGIYLMNKRKTSLALSTISKAENYFEQALGKLGEARVQGMDVGAMQGNLKNASVKHELELRNIVRESETNFKPAFEKQLKRVVEFKERLNH